MNYFSLMQFEWDEAKSDLCFQTRGFDFAYAAFAFADPNRMIRQGQANDGHTDQNEIAGQCAQLAAACVNISTYGLGWDFNESLMEAIARASQGQAYYGETAGGKKDA